MKNQITKILMAAALIIGSSSEANAQFGGLFNAAKNQANKELNKKVNSVTNKKNADDDVQDASVVRLFYVSGNPLGVWNPKTRTLEKYGKDSNGNSGSEKYTFKDDGSVIYHDGRRVGEILADGTMNCAQTQGIKLDNETSQVTFNGEWFGKMDDDGGAFIFNDKMLYANQKMDKQVLCYLLFNIIANNEMLKGFKQKYDEAVKRNEEARQRQLADLRAAQNASSSSVQLWKGGSVAGELRSNDEVWIGGSNRGKFDNNGNIWVGGSVKGQILSDGQIRKGGSIVGKVQNGKVWIGGSVVGEIRANGDVVKGGSVVGRAPGMSDARKVAVIYFFGFYAF